LTLTFLLVALPFLIFADQGETGHEHDCAARATSQASDTKRLQRLFNLDWENSMIEIPEFATEVGFPGQNDRWSDISHDAIARRKRELQAPLQVIHAVNRANLNTPDQLSYDLYRKNYERAVEGTRFPSEDFQITQLGGIQQNIARLLEIAPHTTVNDYEDLATRLNGVPALVDQTFVLLTQGMIAGHLGNAPQRAGEGIKTETSIRREDAAAKKATCSWRAEAEMQSCYWARLGAGDPE
jgi:uncharacterized protein (DUF885 family)